MPDSGTDQRRLAAFLPLEREAECLNAMRNVLDNVPSAYCLVLSSLDGQRLAHVSTREVNASRLAAIIGSLCGLGETLGKELGQTEFRDVMIQTSSGIAVVQRVPPPGQRMVLLAGVGSEANMGIVSSHNRYCAQHIAQLCFPSR
ncbi:MAG: hypothetical protein DI635_12625 [Pseudoxanthomonas suwonensis]|nr:MAG: hypothetical protein DI635_12625 [Pseudoxanthomonas suwonensis]